MTSKLKQALAAGGLILCGASVVSAQTEGRVSVGGSIVFAKPTDSELSSAVSGGPLVRLNPRKGWGPAAAFNWLRVDVDDPTGGSGDFARLRVRPIMAGVSYTIGEQPLLISFSIVAGPSFNKLILNDDFVQRVPSAQVDAETSLAVRPGVGLTLTVAPRVAIVGFGGYLVNRPDVVYRDASQQFTNRWKADSLMLSVGAVYSLF